MTPREISRPFATAMRAFDRTLTRASIGIFLLLLAALPAAAQGLNRGIVAGVVQDTAGVPVMGARVVLRSTSTGLTRETTTPRDGRFDFPFLAAGEYSLRAEQLGYRPRVLTRIMVRTGQRVDVPVALSPTAPPAERVDTSTFAGALFDRNPGLSVSLSPSMLHDLPAPRRDVLEAARLSSLADAGLATEGLPAAYSGLAVDGQRVGTLQSPSLVPGALRDAAFPLSAFDGADLVLTNPDVEWSGSAGGTLDAFAAAGSREFTVRAFGNGSSDEFSTASGVSDSYTTLQGGVRVSGPVVRDTASYAVGVEVWRLGGPTGGLRAPGRVGADLVNAVSDAYSLDLGAGPSETQESNVVSAFGRLDWQLGRSSSLGLRANFADLSSVQNGVSAPPAPDLGRPFDGRDISVSATLASGLSESLSQEAHVGFDRSERTYGGADPLGLSGSTFLLAEGVGIGATGPAWSSFTQSTIHAGETLFLAEGAHQLKFGLAGDIGSYQLHPAAAPSYVFADAGRFVAGDGYASQAQWGAVGRSFTLPQLGLFAQDTWTPRSGLDLLLGVRLDAGRVPGDETPQRTQFVQLAGLTDTGNGGFWMRVSPRFGFTWDVQDQHRWLVKGSAGLYSATVAPELVGQWMNDSGAASVRQGFGSLGWPGSLAPDSATGFTTLPTLTLLSSDFTAPRTVRASLQASRVLGASAKVYVQGLYRYTDRLPILQDLNLWPDATLADANGRPFYGTPLAQSGMLLAEPGSNRRFADYGRVTAVDLSGWSRYASATVGLDQHWSNGLGLFASYTYSRTDDDRIWTGGGVRGADLPTSLTGGGAWSEGRSDFDVPNRVVVGAVAELPQLRALRVGALYRYRSGYPFTPGFGPGVDANGDGVRGNDPAFIDSALEGMSAVAQRWSCIGEQAGAFAERNSCRTPGIHSLDARLALELLHVRGHAAVLTVDGLNLLSSDIVYPDRALYRLDPTAAPVVDPAAGTVSAPLTVNANFGNPLAVYHIGRVLRLGLRLDF
ncbi:MAG TPA: carboxypeptidase regulatory-like domain-containing protein [Longimicrobiaceae bacterium]|nr:carboxypeptidase regulatory-like domain-containing protein [Longimicrobiaceae bacterium]